MAKEKTNGPPATNEPAAASLIDVLGVIARAKPEDLTLLDERILAKEAEIAQILAGHKAELDSLKQLRDIVGKRLGVEPVKKPKTWSRRPKTASPAGPVKAPTNVADDEDSVARRRRIAVLLNVRAPLALASIAKELEIHHIAVLHLMNANRGYFVKRPDELYRLTETGKRDLL